jgi:TPR repeat protein
MTEMAITINDGIRDGYGRVLVRANATYAFRLLRRAVERRDEKAAGPLGYAYDVGQGVRSNKALALTWYRRAVSRGDSAAASNIATIYRDRGNLRLAHRWMLRAMEMGDGDAAVTAGYNHLYGIGARRDVAMARRFFRRALRRDTTQYGREEALYSLAVACVDKGDRKRAIRLVKRAARDGDYPEATSLLAQLSAREGKELIPCRCRRHLRKDLHGHSPCLQHPISTGSR